MKKRFSFNKKELIFAAILIFLYLFTRFYHLLLLPIFTDESIYIYWAKIIQTTHSQWFISLGDGKPPLLVWIIAVFLQIFPHSLYLFAGRFASVVAGFVSLTGIYFLTKDIFKSKIAGFLAALFYIFIPFFLFYDRMALFDSLLCAMLLGSVYFANKCSYSLKMKDALLWGFFLGLAFLSKPTAIAFLGLTPLFMLTNPVKIIKKEWKKMIGLTAVAVIVSELINNLQRVSHIYDKMGEKNAQFQEPLNVFLQHPLKLLPGNLPNLFSWNIGYVTLPFFLLSLAGFLFLLFKNFRKGVVVFLLWFAPLTAFAAIGTENFPRYILFACVYMLIPAAGLLAFIWQRKKIQFVALFLLVGVLLLPLQFDYFLLTNPPKAAIPADDYNQYVSQHPSGYGLNKIFAYIDPIAQREKVSIAVQGTFGLYPYAFELYYWYNPNVRIIAHYPFNSIDQDVIDAQKNSRVFIVFKDFATIPPTIPVRVLVKAEKPGGMYPIYLTAIEKRP